MCEYTRKTKFLPTASHTKQSRTTRKHCKENQTKKGKKEKAIEELTECFSNSRRKENIAIED